MKRVTKSNAASRADAAVGALRALHRRSVTTSAFRDVVRPVRSQRKEHRASRGPRRARLAGRSGTPVPVSPPCARARAEGPRGGSEAFCLVRTYADEDYIEENCQGEDCIEKGHALSRRRETTGDRGEALRVRATRESFRAGRGGRDTRGRGRAGERAGGRAGRGGEEGVFLLAVGHVGRGAPPEARAPPRDGGRGGDLGGGRARASGGAVITPSVSFAEVSSRASSSFPPVRHGRQAFGRAFWRRFEKQEAIFHQGTSELGVWGVRGGARRRMLQHGEMGGEGGEMGRRGERARGAEHPGTVREEDAWRKRGRRRKMVMGIKGASARGSEG